MLDQGDPAGRWHFTSKFPYDAALVQSPSAFRLRALAKSVSPAFVAQHFTCKFPYKVALVKSPSAVRLRRLAQSVCPPFVARRSSCKSMYKVALVKFPKQCVHTEVCLRQE